MARKVAMRFPATATQNRYALSLALNDHSGEAIRQLRVMRAMHGEKTYEEIKAGWAALADVVGFAEAVNLLYGAQISLQREINPKVFAVEEWRSKLAAKASFVLDVVAKPKIFLIGNQHDLDQLGESGADRPA